LKTAKIVTEQQCERLREEVARLVMGWHAMSVPWAYSGATVCWHAEDGIAIVTQYAWRPDEDDRQNITVLEHMLTLGFDCSAELSNEEAVVVFSRHDCDGVPVSHDSRRIAILLASIAALKS
jgi:hypothetical protein